MPEMKTLNGYEIVDAKAREDIEVLKNAGHATEEYVDNAIAAIPEVDLTGYATETYVDNAIANIPKPDLTDYASKEYVEDAVSLATQDIRSDMPTKTSQLTNDSRFITMAELPKTDLSNYALKASVPTKVSQLQNDSKFITREEVPNPDLSAYAKKSEIPDVSGFITSIPSEYITESELNAKGYLTQHQDISGKANKEHEHTNYATKQDLSNTEDSVVDYVTQNYYDQTYIYNNYAKRADVPTKVSQLVNDKNFISEIPSEYVTEGELLAKGYLTQHQSLAGYATEAFVTNKIAEAELAGGGSDEPIDLTGYATKDDIKNFITEVPAEYVTEVELNAKGYLTQHQSLEDYAKKSDIPDVSEFITYIPSEYVTETELNKKGYLTEHQSLAGLATEDYVDAAVAGVPKVDLNDYAKKEDIPDTSGFIKSIPSEYITEDELDAKGYLTEHQSLAGLATTQETLRNAADIAAVEARVTDLETDSSKYLTTIPSEYITATELTNKGYITSTAVAAGYFAKSAGQQCEADITALEARVDDLEAADTSAGPKVITVKYDYLSGLTADEKAALETIGKSIRNNSKFPDGYELIMKIPDNNVWVSFTRFYTRDASPYYYIHFTGTTYASGMMNYELELRYNRSDMSLSSIYRSYSFLDYATEKYVDDAVAAISGSASTRPTYTFTWDSVTTDFSNLLAELCFGYISLADIDLYIQDDDHDLAPEHGFSSGATKVKITHVNFNKQYGDPVEFHAFAKTNSGDFVIMCYKYDDNGGWKATATMKKLTLQEV